MLNRRSDHSNQGRLRMVPESSRSPSMADTTLLSCDENQHTKHSTSSHPSQATTYAKQCRTSS